MKKILVFIFILTVILAAGFTFRKKVTSFLVKDEKRMESEISSGVTGSVIKIGSSSALTGHAGFLGSEYVRGAQVYFNKINAEGGVHGRKVELIAYDDQYDPAKTLGNTQKLINEDKVFALFNYVGTPTSAKIIPLVNEEKIPLVGLFTGANVLRNPLQKYIFNIRASYYQEIDLFIDGVVGELGLTKVAVFYQNDAYGVDGLEGAQIALRKHNLKPVVEANYQRATLDVEEALKKIEASNAEAVVMIGTYAPMAKFIKLAKADGFSPIFQNVSFVGSEALAKELGADGNGVLVTQVVPPPYKNGLLIGVDDYNQLLEEYFPENDPSFGGLEGFVNAKILVEGLKRSGRELNREKLVASLESIQNHSLGIASPVSFSATDHQGMSRSYLTYINDGKFVLFANWQEFKDFISSLN